MIGVILSLGHMDLRARTKLTQFLPSFYHFCCANSRSIWPCTFILKGNLLGRLIWYLIRSILHWRKYTWVWHWHVAVACAQTQWNNSATSGNVYHLQGCSSSGPFRPDVRQAQMPRELCLSKEGKCYWSGNGNENAAQKQKGVYKKKKSSQKKVVNTL